MYTVDVTEYEHIIWIKQITFEILQIQILIGRALNTEKQKKIRHAKF